MKRDLMIVNRSFLFKTGGGGEFDLKRNKDLKKLSNKGVISFNGVDVELSNLGNLLAGYNMKNTLMSPDFVKGVFRYVEEENARKEGYKSWSKDVAYWDEYSDEVRYNAGIKLHKKFGNTSKEKIESITKAIKNTNPVYNERAKKEKTMKMKFKGYVMEGYKKQEQGIKADFEREMRKDWQKEFTNKFFK